jgi:hypothetical protein
MLRLRPTTKAMTKAMTKATTKAMTKTTIKAMTAAMTAMALTSTSWGESTTRIAPCEWLHAGVAVAVFQDGTAPTPPAKETPAADPSAPPTAPEDVLRGPKVPDVDVKSNRPFVEGAKDGEKLSKPVLEQRVYFRAIDLMGFEGDLKEKVNALRSAFVDRVTAYNKVAQAKRAELEAARKKADPTKPPSEEFKREMNKIEAERPKLAELQKEVKALLGEETGALLDKKFAEELKRVRAEQTRQTEEARKKKRAELEEQKKQAAEGKSKDGTPSNENDDGEMKPNV